MRWLFALLLALLPAFPAMAGDVTASPPSDVGVTIYRSPARNGGGMELGSLGGFAVVTETRQISIPAGRSRVRFVGVVDGIIPESAIVSGLPSGIIEKNRDAALLSPSALMRAARGKVLTLTRTNRDTGKNEKVNAEIVSASEDGVMVRTANGVEALKCSGMPETFGYGLEAEGLNAQPTLSVQTRSTRPITATVTLTYIAEGFDWAANYTAQLSPDGRTADIGAWITLANGNSVSLQNARAQIVAGGLHREYIQTFINNQPQVIARCWQAQRTSDIPLKPDRPYTLVNPYIPQDTYDYYGGYRDRNGQIVVTAMRAPMPAPPPMMEAASPVTVVSGASLEQLGDLKLYTVPQRTTVAAMQMKQTRLLEKKGVPVEPYYAAEMSAFDWRSISFSNARLMVRTRNDKDHLLGLPLPAGSILFQQDHLGRTMVVGEPALADTAEDEKIELELGEASDLTVARRTVRQERTSQDVEITISNAGSEDKPFELKLPLGYGEKLTKLGLPQEKRDGQPLFRIRVPAGEKVTLHYTVTRQ